MKLILAFFAIAVLIAVTAYFADRASCYARWEGSGIEASWSVWGGCVVRPPGKTSWIPEHNYREVAP